MSGSAAAAGADAFDRVDGHVFTLMDGGTAISMDQPACAYPLGVSQAEIDDIYRRASGREWFERVVPAPGTPDVELVISWQGVRPDNDEGPVCIENARVEVQQGDADAAGAAGLTVEATFGPPRFLPDAAGIAELPLLLATIHPGAEETYVIDGAGNCRTTSSESRPRGDAVSTRERASR